MCLIEVFLVFIAGLAEFLVVNVQQIGQFVVVDFLE